MTVLQPTDGTAGHGFHVLDPQPGCEAVAWMPASRGEARRKVLRWTCECRPVVYYLITSGGRGYIERTGPGETAVQTSRMRYAPIADLWELVLLGRAR
ncbi:hypothetical protein DQ384_17595 [Sphaerisporangium album]|uniref:Uncharacterized protein n=1 Tax=Sphaerisporangium album TaxID=509200 RepID=A0A367FI53_9ACTN|nr:hypothetical protein [Sphaerisporangium album]RCG29974.1 hypothetical protein DQ384_17595 [Sphaerisporangium album]